MPLLRLALKPGIDKQNTEYGAEGGWVDSDYVRFRYGLPEKIGGWTWFENLETYLIGQVSHSKSWTSLAGVPYLIVGTTKKLYVYSGGVWADITPLRVTTAAGEVTFSASNGSPTITVTDTAHGASAGDFVTFSGAASLGGNITASILNSEYQIIEVLTASTYTIRAPVNATASDSGTGGASVVGAYQISVGQDINLFDYGWGAGPWSGGTWGTPRSTGLGLFARIWQFDLYGEDMVCQLCDGGTYYWNTSSGPSTRASQISGAPTKSTFALVSTPDRHLVCFGTETTIGTASTQDPMFVRFSSQEDVNQFEETATNTAGGQRLTDGNKIITALRSRGQILIFTDMSLHGMQYIGPPYTFGFQQLGANCGCIGAHAAVDINGLAFWMSQEAFYVFDGTTKKLPCTVQDYVFDDINRVQGTRVFVGLNSDFNEVTWWYCSANSNYINRCVTFNYLEQVWSIGTMSRTWWEDATVFQYPLGFEYLPSSTETSISTVYGVSAGRAPVYSQEYGKNAINSAITAYIRSGYFDIGDGDNMLFMSRFLPDFKNQEGDLTVHLLLRAYPQGTATPSSLDPYTITPTTTKVDTRARGRQISLRIESDDVDTRWRYGTLRVDLQPDGLR